MFPTHIDERKSSGAMRLISLSSESEDGIWSNTAEIRFRVALIVLFTCVRSNPAANRARAHALLLARFKSNQFYIYRPSLGGFHNLAPPATPLYPFSGYFFFKEGGRHE